MGNESEALLGWLRTRIKDRGLNNAAIAEKLGVPRPHVRKILTGSKEMTVSELLSLSKLLNLTPEEMGLTGEPIEEGELEVKPVELTAVDPWGNQPEQLVKIAFDLGCDFYFLVQASLLTDLGLPTSVLKQYEGGNVPIKLDAAYHAYNEPRYSEEGVMLTLSFDALYECFFPWNAFKQVVFFPVTPENAPKQEKPEPKPKKSPAPFLRLVT